MSETAKATELLKLAETDVTNALTAAQYGPILTAPPFVLIDGAFNTRDLGLIPGSPLRPNYAFRSGMLGHLTDNGKASVAGKLGVKRIFDLRSPEERENIPDPVIYEVENIWLPTSRPESKIDLSKFVAGEGEAGYEAMYLEVLDVYADSFRAILEHVRDRPQDPFLVHCTAGRDRTGVFGALILALAGASEDAIVLDWQLSRIGTEPVREMLLAYAKQGSNFGASADPAAFHNLVNLRKSCWDAFLKGLDKEYGGFEKYATGTLGFSGEDLEEITRNLREEPLTST
ncbi:protein-tyrosine phosphatase-like protein [Xylariaceae sp. FL0255]|nr:protein-tyrosine phosphatase-like protein [Xylariaceae sp. FL0255]